MTTRQEDNDQALKTMTEVEPVDSNTITVTRNSPTQNDNNENDLEHPTETLSTDSHSILNAKHLALQAGQKGWKEVDLKGSLQFRQEAWLEASARGIDAHGFVPTAKDKEALLIRLTKHGYSEKEAAIRAEEIAERNWSGNPEVTETVKAEAIRSMAPAELADHYPDLLKQAAAIKLAEKFSLSIKNPDDRQAFLATVKDRVATSYDRGQELHTVSVREEKDVEKTSEQSDER